MSFDLERQLIEAAFKTGMPTGEAIQFENVNFSPPPAGFVRITTMGAGGSSLMNVGTLVQRRYPGIVDVAIFVARDVGPKGLRQKADLVETAIAHKTLTSGNVRVTTFGADFVVIGKSGDWHQGNVTIRFERDVT